MNESKWNYAFVTILDNGWFSNYIIWTDVLLQMFKPDIHFACTDIIEFLVLK